MAVLSCSYEDQAEISFLFHEHCLGQQILNPSYLITAGITCYTEKQVF